MKVLVTGGRGFKDRGMFSRVFLEICGERVVDEIIHGGCGGADEMAGEWARGWGIKEIAVHADWQQGAKAGPTRNSRMVAMHPDLVVAFPGGKGTADCVRKARAAGLEVWEISGAQTKEMP